MLSVLVQLVQLRRPREAEAGKGGEDVISLNYRDSRPIYEQIMDGLRRLVVSQVLKPGDKLPSVRELASQLAINPNTIQRAYAELEKKGLTYSVPGKGSFLAKSHESIVRERAAEIRTRLGELVTESQTIGLSLENFQEMTEELWESALPTPKGGNET